MASIDIKHGTVGPTHDPYSTTTIIFTKTDGTEVELYRSEFGTSLKVNGFHYASTQAGGGLKTFDEQVASIEEEFERLTGMTPDKAEHIYNTRLYQPDLMGEYYGFNI